MRRLSICLILLTSLEGGSGAAQEHQQKLKMPGPEVKNLMLGKWSTQIRYAPTPEMPKGGMGAGTEIWRPGPGGLSVIEEYHEKNEK